MVYSYSVIMTDSQAALSASFLLAMKISFRHGYMTNLA